ncbi:MAG: DUF2067 family protein [Candidatus Heimdallarchaeaceae archaeon]
MARATMKEVHVNIPSKEHLEYFIEVISSALKHIEFALTYKLGVLRVKIFGERDEVIQSVNIVKTYGKMYSRSVTPNAGGYYAHHLQLIQQISTKIISIDSISSVLKHSGTDSYIKDQEIYTKASMKEVQYVLSQLYDLIQETPRNIRTQTMKRIILTVSYITNYPPEFIINQGLSLGYFKESRDTVTVNQDPEKCITDLLSQLSGEKAKKKFNEYNNQSSTGHIYIKE